LNNPKSPTTIEDEQQFIELSKQRIEILNKMQRTNDSIVEHNERKQKYTKKPTNH